MSHIWYLYPADQATYQRILRELTPILDREGLSFHVARPSAPCFGVEAAATPVNVAAREETT